MKIDRHNYEAFFLDYFEKNLSPDMVLKLMSFLELNPDLKDEFNEFDLITLEDDSSLSFVFKQSLKKNDDAIVSKIKEDNYQDYMISFIEGNLNPDEINQLNLYISLNPSKKKDLKAFKNTKLLSDKSVVYPYKFRLKHYKISYIGIISYAVAAVIVFLLGLFFLLNNNNYNNNIVFNHTKKHTLDTARLQRVPQNNHAYVLNNSTNNNKIITTDKKSDLKSFIKKQPVGKAETAQVIEMDMIKLNNIKPSELAVKVDNYYPDKLSPVIIDYIAVNDLISKKDTLIISNTENNIRIIEKLLIAKAMGTFGIESLPTNNKKIKRHKINNFWDVAYIFTKTYNKVFDKDAQLTQSFDNKGKLIAVNFESGLFEFDRKIK